MQEAVWIASYNRPGAPRSPVGDRVDPARRQRAASQQTPHCERPAPSGAVDPHRFGRVGGARGVESASPGQERPQRRAIERDQAEHGETERSPEGSDHRGSRISPACANNVSISSISSGALAAPNGPRATSTMSKSARTRGASALQASRSSRRARFRATAPPTRFPETHAARAGPLPGATYTNTRPDLRVVPSRRTRRISDEDRSRPGRSGAELRAALGASASEHGSAGARAHTDAEAMRLLPSALARLVGALHGSK